jgi:hypothetical protein
LNFAICEEDVSYVGASCTSGSDTVCFDLDTYPADISFAELALSNGEGMCANFTGSDFEIEETLDIATKLQTDIQNIVLEAACDDTNTDVVSITFRVISSSATALNTSFALQAIFEDKVSQNSTYAQQDVTVEITATLVRRTWILPVIICSIVFCLLCGVMGFFLHKRNEEKKEDSEPIPDGDSQELVVVEDDTTDTTDDTTDATDESTPIDEQV